MFYRIYKNDRLPLILLRYRNTSSKQLKIAMAIPQHNNLKTFTVNDGWARFVVFFLADPHTLERR
jgi:hypothetical protein